MKHLKDKNVPTHQWLKQAKYIYDHIEDKFFPNAKAASLH
jgi:hypothetical protein